MEDPSLIGVESLQNGDDNNPSDTAHSGNEENAPENAFEDKRQNLPRFRVFKKMRLGRSPKKPGSRGSTSSGAESTRSKLSVFGSPTRSKFFSPKSRDLQTKTSSNSNVNSSSAVKKGNVNVNNSTSNQEVDVVQHPRALLLDPAIDNPVVIPAPPVNNYHPDVSSSTLPSLEKAPSVESSASSCVSANSRNWLDDFGKQNKGNLGVPVKESRQSNASMYFPEKDPRFHCKRTVQPQNQSRDRSSSENAHPESPWSKPQRDPVQQSQVFLAPVIVPPKNLINSRGRRSSRELKEPPRSFASPPPPKRSSVFEANPEAIAAAQEPPALEPSLSHETSSSESHSVAMSSSTTSSMASALVKRLVDSSATKESTKARLQRQAIRSTPIRIKPRVKPQEVQATDQGYASVAKLSAWLADDPTSTKKVRHVRRGANVIAKSRKFEKDLEDVIVEENNISSGAVKEKKDWLKSAFSHHADDGEEEEDDFYDPNRHMMMMRTRPVNFDDDCARSEFVVQDDSASCISVSNKKKWLENAFKKEDDTGLTQKRLPSKAQSDIGPLRESRDEVSSRAKKMWQQKSERRVAGGLSSAQKPAAAPSPYRSNRRPPTSRDGTPRKALEERMRATLGSRASAPASNMAVAANAVGAISEQGSRHSVVGVPLEEDTTPVDFRAARQLLIQRSKDNGNEVMIASKVQRKANKFERLNKDTIRRQSATGLLKPTWESNAEGEGPEGSVGPSDAYTKAFVEDIAPRRSFGELP